MFDWTRLEQPVRVKVDLSEGLTERREHGKLVQGDKNANAIVAEIYQTAGVPYNLAGCTVTLNFVRPDGVAAPPITAEIGGENNNIAVATLTDTCYRYSGMYVASLKIKKGEPERTVVRINGDVISTENNGIVDDEQLFPSPEELLAVLKEIENKTASAVAEVEAKGAETLASIPADYTALAGEVSQLSEESGKLKSAFDDMRSVYTDSIPIDLTDPYTLYITNDNLWNAGGSPSPKSAIEKIPDNAKYVYIKANQDSSAYIAFLASDVHKLNTSPDYATGTGRIEITAGTEAEYSVPSDAEYIYVFLSRSETIYKPTTASFEAYQVIPYERISVVEDKIGSIYKTSFTKPESGNAVINVAFPITANRPIRFYWKTSEARNNELNLYTRETSTGTNVETLIETAKPGFVYTVTPTQDANYLRIVANASGEITYLYADTIESDLLNIHNGISELQKHSTSEPLVNFEFDRTMIDASDIVSKFGLTTENRDTMFSAVYNAFSELAQSYPSYVTEILDAVNGKDGNTPTGLEYPWYANGITANTTRDIPVEVDEQGQITQTVSYTFTKAVSAYKVRLYRLSDTNPALPSSGKKKVFIIGGLHGNEVCAPINLYAFAKCLCNPTDNADMMKLRASCDFYIIPYLNGFGGQYLARVNGNLTDINRNFPTAGWAKTTITDSTFSNLATCIFSGKAPGSEFETKLVMELHDQINPDVFIDHHNSGTGHSQFYSVVTNSLVGNTIYQALTDCASAFLENLPQYFGTAYNLFSGSDVSPGNYTGIVGNSDRWSYEQGVIPSGTCEIFEAINFLNGDFNPSPTKYNADSFSVSEYTLRNVLLHLCQYMMKH